MYSEESISFLVGRIGWNKPIKLDFGVAINSDNLLSTSLRDVSSYHQLATVENLYSNVSETNMTEIAFNEYLLNFKKQAVLDATDLIFKHRLYNYSDSYDAVINEKANLFDEVIGYTIAIKCLELFLSSTRSNATERSNLFSFQSLKVELEGAKNENGYQVATGIYSRRELALRKAHKIIFPEPIELHGDKLW